MRSNVCQVGGAEPTAHERRTRTLPRLPGRHELKSSVIACQVRPVEHQVHERAWLIVIRGEVQVLESDGSSVTGREGFFAEFDPNERREVRARSDARLLLILSPWPGEGHPSRRD